MMLSKRRQQKKREKVRNHVIGQKFQEKTNVFLRTKKKKQESNLERTNK